MDTKWNECVLCGGDNPPKASPSHISSAHDMTYDQYKQVVKEEFGDIDDEDDEDTKKARARARAKAKREDIEERVPSTAEQTVSSIAQTSFKQTMRDMQERKQELQEQRKKAESRETQLRNQLMKISADEKRNQSRGSADDDFLKTLASQYIQDLRSEMKQSKSLEEKLERIIDKKLDEKIPSQEEEELRERKRDENRNINMDITDESVKHVTALGQELIKYMQQGRMMKIATMGTDEDVKQGIKQQILSDLNNFNQDMTGKDLGDMANLPVQGQTTQQNTQQQPTQVTQSTDGKADGKTLAEILAEEEENEE